MSACCFGREHDSVGSIEDGIGDVAGFSPRGAWVFDHRLEHLRGRDHRLPPGGGLSDHVLLDDRHFFGRHLDAEIAARNHHTVGGFEDLFEMINRLGLLQLGNDGDVSPVRRDDLFRFLDVSRRAENDKAIASTP